MPPDTMPPASPPPEPSPLAALGPRERQIMDILYRRGRATAEEVRAELPDPVSNSAVRGMLGSACAGHCASTRVERAVTMTVRAIPLVEMSLVFMARNANPGQMT